MKNARVKVVSSSQHRNLYTISGAICSLVVGLSALTGCGSDDNADVSLPPNKPSSSVKPPKLGSVKVVEPTVAELEAKLEEIKNDPKLDPGKRSMAIGMMEGKIKERKSAEKQ
jgi:hypothetical protein